MGYRLNKAVSYSARGPARRRLRSADGMLMPFLAMCVILLMGAAGIATDLMRNFQAVRELKYAAQTAALYALSLSTTSATSGGLYSQSSIQDAILTPTIPNMAQIGPLQQSSKWTDLVLFASGDIQFTQNPADNSESFLRLTARRQGPTSLTQFFLPLLFSGLNTGLPQSVRTFDTMQTVEVLGQPATRIGAGPPAGQVAGTRAADFSGCAALPIAISYQQFATKIANTNSGAGSVPCVIDLIRSTNQSPSLDHVPAAFVNLSATAGGVNYYSGAQGPLAVGQLQSLLAYFASGAAAQASVANPPSFVECGSQLSAYDPADPNFTNAKNQAQIIALINSLPARTYILPVIAGGQPLLATAKSANVLNNVVGFAYVQLPKQNLTAQPFILNLTLVQSPPLRNASSAAGLASLPLGTSNLMPTPPALFMPRAYDTATGGVTMRVPGVALAPALSPRPLNAQ